MIPKRRNDYTLGHLRFYVVYLMRSLPQDASRAHYAYIGEDGMGGDGVLTSEYFTRFPPEGKEAATSRPLIL